MPKPLSPFTTTALPEHPWYGANVGLATQHGKAQGLARPLKAALGLTLTTLTDCNTDVLGTFTGEIPRAQSPKETVLLKTHLARAAGFSYGIATEASFGPHPTYPWMASQEEWLAFVDFERKISVLERLQTHQTNYRVEVVQSWEAAEQFCSTVGFPSHAVILRSADDPQAFIRKGIQDLTSLQRAWNEAHPLSAHGAVRLETDMRAHLNPTRMRQIRKLAIKLARRLRECCPGCGTPGFGDQTPMFGLPCSNCGTETPWVRAVITACPQCDYHVIATRPDGLRMADPMHCPECNP
jgi:predicted RNA-binding Zn-ribbon protein involved in translation (DUF1610 family)